MAVLCALLALVDMLDTVDIGSGCLVAAVSAFGVPQLFEVDGAQHEAVSLTQDSLGNPVIKLRHGGMITRAVAEQLNALIGETYHKGREAALTSDDESNAP